MTRIKNAFKQLAIAIFLISTLSTNAKDIAGSSDHNLVTRYSGSSITFNEEIEFGDYRVPMSAPFKVSTKEYSSEMTKTLQGKITRLVYASAKDASDLQIHENYLSAFQKPSFEIVRQCKGTKCDATAKTYARYLAQKRVAYHDKGQAFFIAAKYTQEGAAPVYIVVLNGPTNRGNSHIIVDIIETKAIELGKVTTNVDALLASLDQVGSAQIYDIFFDTGKAVVKPESKNALEAISKVLSAKPQMNLYVVGHTDDTGSLATNTKLAKDRAEAIVKNLVSNYGINKDRVYGAGAGPFSPVASNETEQGRAKNRRVEIVKRLPQ